MSFVMCSLHPCVRNVRYFKPKRFKPLDLFFVAIFGGLISGDGGGEGGGGGEGRGGGL